MCAACKGVVKMVVKSVVRRSRLKELGVGGATFGAAGALVPVGATVQIPRDKKIKVSVTVENTGSRSVSGDFYLDVYYADTLSDPGDDPEDTLFTWISEADAHDTRYRYSQTLNAGVSETWEGDLPVDASTWSEGTKIDAGIVLRVDIGGIIYYLDILKIADAVEIIAPTRRVEITNVTFFEM